ncbi:hypothetical protein MKX01_012614 [Papaver californicum]|nr:hypothetical protein MKX01_012614 [Papaver californicum]
MAFEIPSVMISKEETLELKNNPLLQDFVFHPFDVIEPRHVRPGIKTLLKQLENDLVVLEKSVEPTWSKLPEKVKFLLRLGQSKPIYNAFKAIQESSEWQTLSDSRKRIFQWKIKVAVLNGVLVEDDKIEQFNKMQQELEKFDKKDIDGLPASALALAAQIAVSKGHEKATILRAFNSVATHSRNRSWREDVHRARVTRASDGENDNSPIIDQILKLRLEKAKLLGYDNYAEVSMAMKMATVDNAKQLLEKIRTAAWNASVQDMEDLKKFSLEQGAVEANDLSHWDISFWSERLRESKYDINEEGLRPYFSLPKVMDGLFGLAKTLFDIDIEAANGLAPVWNDDVRFYRVKDSLGNPVAYFYFDPYFRPSEKRDRAFARAGASARLPVAYVVCNQSPPVGDKPSLMTFREIETVFHEFGHAFQHMLTKEDESLVSGMRGIEWDAIELPSQFLENWCYQRNTFFCLAKHYETGEALPEEIYLKLLAARTYRAGSLDLHQILYASSDLELHVNYIPGGSESIFDVWRRDRFFRSFNHIFARGYEDYAAGCYCYMWGEVLSADAFSAFEDVGLDNEEDVKEIGHKFRDTVLALGGGKPPLEVFVQFRGREPSPEALLRRHGLLTAAAVSV